jgi:hypothetical protein
MSTGPLINGGYAENLDISKERSVMKAIRETTLWDSPTPNHVYLVDGNKLVAYIRQGTDEPVYFTTPIKGFDIRRRTFVEVLPSPFDAIPVQDRTRTILGSKPGVTYTLNLDRNTCTCPGFQFRGACKHVKELEPL